jgi:hypothetical protein
LSLSKILALSQTTASASGSRTAFNANPSEVGGNLATSDFGGNQTGAGTSNGVFYTGPNSAWRSALVPSSAANGQSPSETTASALSDIVLLDLVRANSDYSNGSYTPPLHGTNPHGEGTAASITTEPRSTPDSSDCTTPSKDEVVGVGRSCGQQNSDGSYSGHVTVASLGGQELFGESSTPSGTTYTGSLAPLLGPTLSGINGGLAQVCSNSGNQICVSLLSTNSSTTSSGSTNSFQGANAELGGASGISASALDSNGDISQTGSCQTADGGSSVANVAISGTTLANAAQSNDSSTACQDPSQNSQTHSSQVLGGQISNLTSPILGAGCAGGTPTQPLSQLPAQLVALFCNEFDSNGAQAAAPYGTAEGLTAILLGGLGAHTAASESLARAPSLPSVSPNGGGAPNAGPGPTGTPGGAPEGAPSGALPFTGLDAAGLLGLALALGLGGTGLVWWTRRTRTSPV